MAGAMIARALAAKVPFGWLAADSVCSVGSLETILRRAGKGYVLGVSSEHRVNSWGMAPQQIQPAYIIAWSTWRRTHQAAAQRTHPKTKMFAVDTVLGVKRKMCSADLCESAAVLTALKDKARCGARACGPP